VVRVAEVVQDVGIFLLDQLNLGVGVLAPVGVELASGRLELVSL